MASRFGVLWGAALVAILLLLHDDDAFQEEGVPECMLLNSCDDDMKAVHPYRNTNKGLRPTVMQEFGRLHYFQVPNNPKGTVVVFPGCARAVQGFWPFDPKECSACFGMPEDVSNTKQILKKGYAILVLSPQDTKHLCWSQKVDFPDVVAILKKFLTEHSLMNKPLYTMGASSGGGISMGLAGYAHSAKLPWLKVKGVIQTVSTNTWPTDRQGKLRNPEFPPVAFVVMSNPVEKRKAQEIAETLKKFNVPTGVAVSGKKKVTDTYFSDRIPAISPAKSKIITATLRRMGQIDEEGTMLSDPKRSGWDLKLRKSSPLFAAPTGPFTMVFRRSAIWQAMTHAYANHEHTSEYTTAALSWFESGPSGKFEEFARREAIDKPAALTI